MPRCLSGNQATLRSRCLLQTWSAAPARGNPARLRMQTHVSPALAISKSLRGGTQPCLAPFHQRNMSLRGEKQIWRPMWRRLQLAVGLQMEQKTALGVRLREGLFRLLLLAPPRLTTDFFQPFRKRVQRPLPHPLIPVFRSQRDGHVLHPTSRSSASTRKKSIPTLPPQRRPTATAIHIPNQAAVRLCLHP